jgi:hypothetical protein
MGMNGLLGGQLDYDPMLEMYKQITAQQAQMPIRNPTPQPKKDDDSLLLLLEDE